jgi:hypothetical protein
LRTCPALSSSKRVWDSDGFMMRGMGLRFRRGGVGRGGGGGHGGGGF